MTSEALGECGAHTLPKPLPFCPSVFLPPPHPAADAIPVHLTGLPTSKLPCSTRSKWKHSIHWITCSMLRGRCFPQALGIINRKDESATFKKGCVHHWQKRRDWSDSLSESKTKTPLTHLVHSTARHFTPRFTANTLEKEMATHPSILAWRILWSEEPGKLQFTGSQRVRHDLAIEQ